MGSHNLKKQMPQKTKIYLDDVRTPTESGWMVVRDYNQFCSAVRNIGLENISVIQFDHDLGEKSMHEWFVNGSRIFEIDYNNIRPEMTGYDCAKWLIDFFVDSDYIIEQFPDVYTHSANPIGCANIEGIFNAFFKVNKIKKMCTYRKVNFDYEKRI